MSTTGVPTNYSSRMPDKHTVAVTLTHAYKQGVFGFVGAGCDVFLSYGVNTDVR